MTQSVIDRKKPCWLTDSFASNGDCTITNGQKAVPQSGEGIVNVKTGFPVAFSNRRAIDGKSVTRKDMNAILNQISSLHYYFQYMGRNPYNPEVSPYPKGAIVWYSDAEYVNTVDNNSETPDHDSWVKLDDLSGNLGSTGQSGVGETVETSKIYTLLSILSNSISMMSQPDFVFDGENAVTRRISTPNSKFTLVHDAFVPSNTTIYCIDNNWKSSKQVLVSAGSTISVNNTSANDVIYPINAAFQQSANTVSISDDTYADGLTISQLNCAKVVCSVDARSAGQVYLQMALRISGDNGTASLTKAGDLLGAEYQTFSMSVLTLPGETLKFDIHTYIIETDSSGNLTTTKKTSYPNSYAFRDLKIDVYETL